MTFKNVFWLGYIKLLALGVQSVYEDVALDTNRGHTVKAVCQTFNLAKDAGYKVVAHMMPNLPNVDLERDVEQFIVSFFWNPYEFLRFFTNFYRFPYFIIIFTNINQNIHE